MRQSATASVFGLLRALMAVTLCLLPICPPQWKINNSLLWSDGVLCTFSQNGEINNELETRALVRTSSEVKRSVAVVVLCALSLSLKCITEQLACVTLCYVKAIVI